jgi:hypothetical protein
MTSMVIAQAFVRIIVGSASFAFAGTAFGAG